MLLEINDLCKNFGGLQVTNHLSMNVEKGEIHGLLGPNGAGKSTLFNMITGVFPPSSGQIMFDGRDITKAKPHETAAMGIGRTFQLNPLFSEFTVLKNVETSFYLHPHSSFFDIFFNTKKHRQNQAHITEQALEILNFLGLEQKKDVLAKNLPHGYQKILGVARALATQPTLLMLDEPLGGMNPEEIEFSINAIQKMRDRGITILIVEHNMQILTALDRVTVISFGEKIFEGTPEEMRNDSTVIETYFGGSGNG